MFGDTDTEHGHKHDANRTEAHEARDHFGEQGHDVLAGKLVDDDDALAGGRMEHVEADVGQKPRQHPDDPEQRDEEHGWIRQLVADTFDGSQKPRRLIVCR